MCKQLKQVYIGVTLKETFIIQEEKKKNKNCTIKMRKRRKYTKIKQKKNTI